MGQKHVLISVELKPLFYLWRDSHYIKMLSTGDFFLENRDMDLWYKKNQVVEIFVEN